MEDIFDAESTCLSVGATAGNGQGNVKSKSQVHGWCKQDLCSCLCLYQIWVCLKGQLLNLAW